MERERRAAHERMRRELTIKVLTLAGTDGSVLVGGTPEAAHDVVRTLTVLLPGRVLGFPKLDIHARDAEIRAAAELGAAALRRTRDESLVKDILARSAADDLAALGGARTMRALADHAVDVFCISECMIERDPVLAEAAVRLALAQQARVEIVRNDPDDSFEEAGDGLGATLRFSPYRVPTGAGGTAVSTDATDRPTAPEPGVAT
ncbi:MAG TPA: hypothetical protein VMM18_08665 [Gemmatimonadaceae bacterium]|nr:hypothetical protein [Gemmatimonadaceae bacterium]